MKLTKEQFFEKYNINQEEYEKAEIDWEILSQIYQDYVDYRNSLIPSAETIANILRQNSDIHSVKSRIKNSEHLIDKIIRKTIRKKKDEPDYSLTVDNYKDEITDLIGIRILHLYKDQAVNIDKYIRSLWELLEPCTIYYREGDFSSSEEFEENSNFKFQVHPAGYRSWHYLISTKITMQEHVAEIQVRTIFEEGWSEIDHLLRYPNNLDNLLLKDQLLVLNRIAGSADEMANTIRETKVNMEKLITKNNDSDKLISELKEQLEEVLEDNEIKEADRKKLEGKVKELENSRNATEGIFGRYVEYNPRASSVVRDGMKLIGDSIIKRTSGLSGVTDNNSYLGVSVPADMNDGLFSTKKYLEGYTHPALKKNE
jgi:putative GTP pyrophosphokinase